MDELNSVTSYIHPLVSSLYIKQHFPESDQSETVRMAEDIKNAFTNMLDDLDWMDNYETKRNAKEKARAIGLHVGYPKQLSDMSILSNHFLGLQIGQDTYFENYLNMNKLQMKYFFSRLRYESN